MDIKDETRMRRNWSGKSRDGANVLCTVLCRVKYVVKLKRGVRR